MFRRKRRGQGTAAPVVNDNITMAYGPKTLTDRIFDEIGLNSYLDGLKRNRGESVSAEVRTLVSCSEGMTGISVNRIDRMLDDPVVRREYGLGAGAPRSIYRTIERLGRNYDEIIGFVAKSAKRRWEVPLSTVFMDWTSMYFEVPQKDFVHVEYSRDHRSDRPQVTVGLSMDHETGLPMGLTIKPGNILDKVHFPETFEQIRPLLPEGATVVFDNGAYTMKNARMVEKAGFGFVTRLQLNNSDDAEVKRRRAEFEEVENGVYALSVKGNLGRTRWIFLNERLKADVLYRYRRKAERDWEEMQIMKKAIDKNKKPRKKYRNSNSFVDTKLSYAFALPFTSKEKAIEWTVNKQINGREGLFVLVSTKSLSASEALEAYRSRGDVETAFRDLEHGIDWRPARATSPDAIRGRISVSFLALFCMSAARFLHREYRHSTAVSMLEELRPFSLTVERGKDGTIRHVWSNFTPLIRSILGAERSVPVPKALRQTELKMFSG